VRGIIALGFCTIYGTPASFAAGAARQLLERTRPELAFAGVKTNPRATAAEAPAALEQLVQDILADLHPARAPAPWPHRVA